MKKTALLLLVYLCCLSTFAQTQLASTTNEEARVDFQNRRFGLFIHWGIYSVLGDGEWVMHNEKIPYRNYSRLASFFNPTAFDAKAWVAMAKAAGMKYITITSRHHDGFSMFSTAASPYNIVAATPYGRDPLKDLAEACHRQGVKLFFYYSLLDWGRPDYAFGSPIRDGKPTQGDWEHYISFMKQQLTELLTNYGEVAGIWFDGEWERPEVDWHFDEIYALIHRLQPQAMVGNNHHHMPRPGEDFQMFEKDLPGESTKGWGSGAVDRGLPLETCETMNDSWGFNINDTHYKTAKQIIHYLVNAAGRNGNFLLNVGPMPNGKIQPEFVDTLSRVGAWLSLNGEAVYDTKGAVVAPQPWGVVTSKAKRLYVHVLQGGNPFILIPGLSTKVLQAWVLSSKQTVRFHQQREGLFLYTNGLQEDPIDTIIVLETQ